MTSLCLIKDKDNYSAYKIINNSCSNLYEMIILKCLNINCFNIRETMKYIFNLGILYVWS